MVKRLIVVLILVVLLTFSTALRAQELLYGQREMQVSYNGNTDIPAVVFNGKDFAAFYLWSGKEDKNTGLHMRRIDIDGKAFGPQRLVLPISEDINFSSITAIWDGSAYVVFFAPGDELYWHIVRVDTRGTLLGQKKVQIPEGESLFWRYLSFAVADRAYLFFSTTEGPFLEDGFPYLISVDLELKQKPIMEKLPLAGLKNPKIFGVALDPDKFLVFMGQYKEFFAFENEIDKASLLHIDFAGKVKKVISPAITYPRGSDPAEQLQSVDINEATGPLYTGDGYILIGTRETDIFFFFAPANNSYPYTNTSVKIDDSGKIIDGPYNLGNGDFGLFLGKPLLLGSYIGIPFLDLIADDTQMMVLGKRGRHVTDVSVHETFFSFDPETVNAAYSGRNSVVTNFGLKDRFEFFDAQWAIYSNVLTSPKFVQPAIVYFKSSEGSPFGDNRRLVMWSAADCTNVTLSGQNFEMTNLPPVFHTVVDTNGERTVLRLTITTVDGGTKTKRLVIEP